MAEPRHDLTSVPLEQRDEVGVVRRPALDPGARLAELLPYQQAEAVAVVVELVGLDQPPAPDTDQVHMRRRSQLEQARELVRARHAVERVDRAPVPPLDRRSHAVDEERVVVCELHRPEADAEAPHLVQMLLPHAVRPPEPRLLHAQHDLALELHGAEPVLQADVGTCFRRCSVERDRAPDALVDHPRTEVPAVAHPALVDAHPARDPHLRLALRRRVNDDRNEVLALPQLDGELCERAFVVRGLDTVDEDGRRVVDSREADRPRALDPTPVDPGPLRHPLGEPAVAAVVRIRDLTGAPEVVEDAARDAGGQPARRIPGLLQVPAPLVAEAAAELPFVPTEAYCCHSSRFVSTTAAERSAGTRNVLISRAPKSASIVRPATGSSIVPWAGRPADS